MDNNKGRTKLTYDKDISEKYRQIGEELDEKTKNSSTSRKDRVFTFWATIISGSVGGLVGSVATALML